MKVSKDCARNEIFHGHGHGDGRTFLFDVWQLRHDWVVLLRLRFLWSMSMVKSRSSRSPFMTCGADSANMATTSSPDEGGNVVLR